MEGPNIFERSIKPTTNNLCLLLSWYQERLLKLSRNLSARWSLNTNIPACTVSWNTRMCGLIIRQQSRSLIKHPSERVKSLHFLHIIEVIFLILFLLENILEGPFDSCLGLNLDDLSRVHYFCCWSLTDYLRCTEVWIEWWILLLAEQLLLLLLLLEFGLGLVKGLLLSAHQVLVY